MQQRIPTSSTTMWSSLPRPSEKLGKRAGYVAAAILGGAAVLHFYWAVGGDWGLNRALGLDAHDHPPQWIRPASAVVGLALSGGVSVLLGRAGLLSQRASWWVFRRGTWIMASVLFLVALINFTGRTLFEVTVIAPFSLFLGGLCAVLAASKQNPVETRPRS